jgi:hypothetical protein
LVSWYFRPADRKIISVPQQMSSMKPA